MPERDYLSAVARVLLDAGETGTAAIEVRYEADEPLLAVGPDQRELLLAALTG